MRLQIDEIIKAVKGSCDTGSDAVITAITTDTREISPDCLFIALKGERFDGHSFVDQALNQGAAAAVVENSFTATELSGKPIIKVENTYDALLMMARYYRSSMPVKVIGVTGSVGKTTTKDMIAAVLEQSFTTHKTSGNLNNHVGLPKTIFGLEPWHQTAVLEMGMSSLGEISRLSCAAQPDIGVITSIGVSHLENLKTRENILKAKLEILDGMSHDGVIIINADNDLLGSISNLKNHTIIKYGTLNTDCDICAENIKSSQGETFFDIIYGENQIQNVMIPTVGLHNVLNALAAAAVGLQLKMKPAAISAGLREYLPSGMRQKLTSFAGMSVIEDCYNASPDSMRASLNVLGEIAGEGRKIAVLGDMLELGELSAKAHYEIGAYAAQLHVNVLLAYGSNAQQYIAGATKNRCTHTIAYEDKEQLAQDLISLAKAGDTILFKASRGVRLEDVLKLFYERQSRTE